MALFYNADHWADDDDGEQEEEQEEQEEEEEEEEEARTGGASGSARVRPGNGSVDSRSVARNEV